MSLRVLTLSPLVFSLLVSTALAAPIRLDVDPSNPPRGDTTAVGWTQWALDVDLAAPTNRAASHTFSGVTFAIAQTAPSAANANIYLNAMWVNKDYLSVSTTTSYLMAGDGVVVYDNTNGRPYLSGGAMSLTITGLSAGTHTITTYHNNIWRHVNTTGVKSDTYGAMSKTIVTVGGQTVATVTPSEYVVQDNASAFAYFTVTAVAGTPVVINFAPDHSQALDGVIINGIEVDHAPPGVIASNPTPADQDLHVDCGNDNPAAGQVAAGHVTLSWTGATGATKRNVYLGTNATSVGNATTSSPEYLGSQTALTYAAKNLSSMNTYYWRIDEVSSSGAIAKGDVWTFKPRHLAFPGAVGYGRWSHSGRGGTVVEVTNLNDSGAGSLRDALQNHTGPRVVVFRTGGVIPLSSEALIDLPHADVYIAGQTAPGSGIVITNFPIGPYATTDVTLRHVRNRIGDYAMQSENGPGLSSDNHCIIDHCSVSWALDVGINELNALNTSYTYNIVSEGLNDSYHYNGGNRTTTEKHSFMGSIGGHFGTYYKNLGVHNTGRNFSLAGGVMQDGKHYDGFVDVRNNVFYDWKDRTTDGGVKALNFVGNFYKGGVNSTLWQLVEIDGDQLGFGDYQQGYIVNNKMIKLDGTVVLDSSSDDWSLCISDYATIAQVKSTVPLLPSDVVTQSADAAYTDVLANAGATKPARDFIDTRIVTEVKNGTYTYVGSKDGLKGIIDSQDDVCDTVNGTKLCGYALVAAKMDQGTAPTDSDHDGMPDAWETAHGLNPNNAADGNYDPDCDGFTNLDDYLAYMAGDVASVASKGGGTCASAAGGSSGQGGSSGATGTGGTTGSGGGTGTGGSSGQGGSSGAAGQGGSSGTVGSGGTTGGAGASGAGGTTGAGGSSGQGGSSGAPGQGGSSGTAGSGGTSGTGGVPGTGGGAGADSSSGGGCSCALARGNDSGPGELSVIGVAVAFTLAARRRRSRAGRPAQPPA
ncbi:MAG TPA: hypothetical protein VKZ18_19565 [Polyangia bacterium]|nr:hypothetical protein [Polyangia bacterium]